VFDLWKMVVLIIFFVIPLVLRIFNWWSNIRMDEPLDLTFKYYLRCLIKLFFSVSTDILFLVFFYWSYIDGYSWFTPAPLLNNWSFGLVIIFVGMVLFTFMVDFIVHKIKPEEKIELSPIDSKEIAQMKHRNWSALFYASLRALNAGTSEELNFRFGWVMVFQLVITIICYWFKFDPMVLVSFIPSWLVFGAATFYVPIVFLAMMASNAIFALIHVVSQETRLPDIRLTYRVVYAWIAGMVFILALPQVGLLGVMFLHFVADVLIITPFLVQKFNQIAKEYHDEYHFDFFSNY